MRRAIALWIAAAVLCFWGATSGLCADKLETRHINGRSYVRVANWAKVNQFEVQWLRREEVLQLRNKSTTLELTVDSRVARVNGVNAWLNFPVLGGNGGVYLSTLDVNTTLGPLLFPPRKGSRPIKTICLDPGHGGRDPGYRVRGYEEKTYTMLLAQELKKVLVAAGYNVVLTRSTDVYVDHPDRPRVAQQRKADLFVSLHFNAGGPGSQTAQGVEVYCLTPAGAFSTNVGKHGETGALAGNDQDGQNMFLAYSMQKSLVRGLGIEDRGVRRARFAVLRDAEMPAILIEAGFMSHPTEGKRIVSASYRKKIAVAIRDGLNNYKRVVSR